MTPSRPWTIAFVFLCGFLATPWTHAQSPSRWQELDRRFLLLSETDPEAVDAFIEDYSSAVQQSDLGRRRAALEALPLELQLPVSPLQVRAFACTWSNGNGCGAPGQCCGTIEDGWCCDPIPRETCCEGFGPRKCCSSSSFCCGQPMGTDSGTCCTTGTTCCTGGGRKPFCCAADQKCDLTAGMCINPTTTVTNTYTQYLTQYVTAQASTDATSSILTTVVKMSTITITLSNVATATEMVTVTQTITDTATSSTPSLRAGKRAAETTASQVTASSGHESRFNVRPGVQLDALAQKLKDRGFAIERRATVTYTNTVTVPATVTSTVTAASTNWHTAWLTQLSTDYATATSYMNAQTTVTSTTTVTTHVATQSTDSSTPTPTLGSSTAVPTSTIVGASVGGAAGAIVLILAAVILWRHRKHDPNPPSTGFTPSTTTGGHGLPESITAGGGMKHTSSYNATPMGHGTHVSGPPPPMGYMEHHPPPPVGYMDPQARDSTHWGSQYTPEEAWNNSWNGRGGSVSPPVHGQPMRMMTPQELYHAQYMAGLGLPEMRGRQTGAGGQLSPDEFRDATGPYRH